MSVNEGKNGRVLTAKHLPENVYLAVHKAPHGTRQDILKGILSALADFAAKEGDGWHVAVMAGKTKLVHAK